MWELPLDGKIMAFWTLELRPANGAAPKVAATTKIMERIRLISLRLKITIY